MLIHSSRTKLRTIPARTEGKEDAIDTTSIVVNLAKDILPTYDTLFFTLAVGPELAEDPYLNLRKVQSVS